MKVYCVNTDLKTMLRFNFFFLKINLTTLYFTNFSNYTQFLAINEYVSLNSAIQMK